MEILSKQEAYAKNSAAGARYFKDRDGWNGVTRLVIPGKPTEYDDEDRFRPGKGEVPNNCVQVRTCKASNGLVRSYASECTMYGTSWMSKPFSDWSATLFEGKARLTEKSVREVHDKAMAKLREIRPELFQEVAPAEGLTDAQLAEAAAH